MRNFYNLLEPIRVYHWLAQQNQGKQVMCRLQHFISLAIAHMAGAEVNTVDLHVNTESCVVLQTGLADKICEI
jgi:hypothetical protein